MKSDFKIAVLGGDLRQYAAASTLCEHGWKIALWGLERSGDHDGRIEHCDSFDDAVRSANAWLLPLPSTIAGNMLNCPLYTQGKGIKLKDILAGELWIKIIKTI